MSEELKNSEPKEALIYSTFNRHAATALVCLTADLGAYDCVFGHVGRGVAKSVLFTLGYIAMEVGVVSRSFVMIVLGALSVFAIEIIATVDSFRISCAKGNGAIKDSKGRIVRGSKWGLSLAIPRIFACLPWLFVIMVGSVV